MQRPSPYPFSVLDLPNVLISALGSFWSTTYLGAELVEALCAAKLAAHTQTWQDGQELIDAVSRFNVDVLHTENWYELTLRASDVNDQQFPSLKFGETGHAFTEVGPDQFGQQIDRKVYAWPLPEGLTTVPLIFNRLTSSSLTLTLGIDYQIQDGYLVFRDNPFDNALIPQTTLFIDNEPADQQLSLFLFKGQFDHQAVYQQFGYVLGLQLPSSQAYKDLVNALFDALVLGSTSGVLLAALSAVTGIPTAIGDETVQMIVEEVTRTLVITDQRVYSFDPSATVTVAVGQSVHQGDMLTDAMQLFEFNRGQCPAADQLSALTLGKGFLLSGFYADLSFENADTPLIVTTDPDGYTKISWAMTGWPGDPDRFFDELHARGRASGQTLAYLLDQRPAAVRDGEPAAGALPATINPLQFLCQNVLRTHFIVVKIKATAATGGAGTNAAKFLSRIIPPQTALLLVVELAVAEAPLILDGPGDVTTPGYTEDGGLFLSVAAGDTIDPDDFITDSGRIYQLVGRCI
jgi:hypothetical protein